jgi:hypothetical protein
MEPQILLARTTYVNVYIHIVLNFRKNIELIKYRNGCT